MLKTWLQSWFKCVYLY